MTDIIYMGGNTMAKKDLGTLIEKSNLSMRSFSKSCGVSRFTLYNLIDGKAQFKNLSIINAINLCRVLGCKLSDLVDDEHNEEILEFEKLYK